MIKQLRTKKLAVLNERISNCEKCDLCETRTKTVPGTGSPKARIMLVGEGPGEHEDLEGKPFVGKSGKLLDHLLRQAKLTRSKVFITNTVKCRPPGNRKPEIAEVDACREYLERQIKIIKPKVIVAIGVAAMEALTRNEHIAITAVRGETFSTPYADVLIGTLHPSYLFRNPKSARLVVKDLRLAKRLALG